MLALNKIESQWVMLVKFAGPQAQGVSEPRQQSSVPPFLFPSGKDTIYGVLGEGPWPMNPSRLTPAKRWNHVFSRSKITPEIDDVFHRFW